MNGMGPAAAASSRLGVAPGLRANFAPRSIAHWRSSGVRTVPIPTIASGTSAMVFRAASTAAMVRNVITSRRSPPATSARASGTASSTRSMVMTGTSLPNWSNCSSPVPTSELLGATGADAIELMQFSPVTIYQGEMADLPASRISESRRRDEVRRCRPADGPQTYEEAAARWSKQRGGGQGGDYYWTKLTYLGRDYVSLALEEYRRNRITENQLADYLDVKPKNLAGIEEHFERGSS